MKDNRFVMETAGGARICNPCGRKIRMGENCLAFSKGSGRYSVSGNVCRQCLVKFVEKTRNKEVSI
ncbi:MAG: hypothetical protein A2252_09135 [Elusimicrobia bacterium RIFOXYA2_FULL_39_19]|nr:MAG: hypothetical protein A2252_09135 [Elusimicrobia bacterium RIFOXYA2_FULL_39_19]